MARVGGLVVVGDVAAGAGIGRVVVIAVVAGSAIIGNGCVRSGQRVKTAVIESRRYPGRFGMAGGAIRRELRRHVVGIGGLVVVGDVTAGAGVRRVVVIAVVAGSAIIRYARMRAVQGIIVVVNGESGRFPAGCSMATGAVRRDIQRQVIRVGALVVIRGMATGAIGGSACIPRSVTINAIGREVRPSQREAGVVVIKSTVRFARRVTGQTGGTVVRIPVDAVVVVVGFGIGMAVGAGEFCKIGRIGMAIHTLAPFTVVGTTVNWEILPVVIKSSGHPGCFAVATGAVRRELRRRVVGIGGLVVIGGVAARAGIRCIVVVAVVAGRAVVGHCCVRTVQRMVIVVDGKGGRHPVHIGVASRTVSRDAERVVIGVGRLVVIRCVAARTGIGRVVIVAVVTGIAVIGNGCVCAR